MRFFASAVILCAAVWAQPDQYDPIYRGEAGDVFIKTPNQFLVNAVRGRKPGRALDVGTGQGRNAIYLAGQGWSVTAFDSAGEGIRLAREESRRLGLRIQFEVTTFEKFDFGENRWDLIVLTYEPAKQIAPRVASALAPGGIVVVEDRHLDTRRVWPAGTFSDNELLALFPGLRVLKYEDVWAMPDWSASKVEERLVRLVAEKPSPLPPGCVWDVSSVQVGRSVCWGALTLHCTKEGWQIIREKCAP